MTIQELIQFKFTGEIDQTLSYVNVSIQAIGVLIGGLLIWRAMSVWQRKKNQERRRNPFFESSFSKHWRK
jgi:uncharacterized membrane protein YidH (DUF202 family)